VVGRNVEHIAECRETRHAFRQEAMVSLADLRAVGPLPNHLVLVVRIQMRQPVPEVDIALIGRMEAGDARRTLVETKRRIEVGDPAVDHRAIGLALVEQRPLPVVRRIQIGLDRAAAPFELVQQFRFACFPRASDSQRRSQSHEVAGPHRDRTRFQMRINTRPAVAVVDFHDVVGGHEVQADHRSIGQGAAKHPVDAARSAQLRRHADQQVVGTQVVDVSR